MKITTLKKISKERYKTTFDNSDEKILYANVIVKYGLLPNKVIDDSLWKKISEDNYEAEVYNQALNYLSIRIRSKFEIEAYLNKKGYADNLINHTINLLSKEGYIDDYQFAKAFINDKLTLTNDGPYKIKRMLDNYKVDESIIDSLINDIDQEVIKEKVIKLINKQLTINHKYTGNALKNRVVNYLINLGYEKDLIWLYLNDVKIEEKHNLKDEYDKLYKKYASKYSGPKLKLFIKQKLYQKGYENINFDEL